MLLPSNGPTDVGGAGGAQHPAATAVRPVYTDFEWLADRYH